jgi:hypothetical protein
MNHTAERVQLAVMRTHRLVANCHRIHTLAAQCATAVDRSNQAWAGDLPLYDTLMPMASKPWSHPKAAAKRTFRNGLSAATSLIEAAQRQGQRLWSQGPARTG